MPDSESEPLADLREAFEDYKQAQASRLRWYSIASFFFGVTVGVLLP